MAGVYLRVWEYEVPADHVGPFIAAYGAEGDWARLFGRAEGYLGTGLFRDVERGGRFLTVDRWADEAAWRSFLDTSREAYEALDRRLEGIAATERPLLDGNG